MREKPVEQVDTVVIRFAGDSGDGMQLTGTQFTNESAIAGNDIATLPDYPAEIRAPAGTLAGVSGFQVNFSQDRVFTPGDRPDVLVVMNPAAFSVNIADLSDGGILVADSDAFTLSNIRKAGMDGDPLADASLNKRVRVFAVPLTRMTTDSIKDMGLPNKTMVRCKNFFALGLCSWMFNRPIEQTLTWIGAKFAKSPALVEANTRVFKAGWNFGETTEVFVHTYEVKPADIEPGNYTNLTGNRALALGLMAAASKAVMTELPLVIVNVQRGGPSTGLPTKTEQADLMQALYGRNGESPLAIVAPATPVDCFDMAFEAVHVALKYMVPVMILSDGYLANGAQPWKIPDYDELPDISVRYWKGDLGFHPYLRNEDTLARPWVIPGTPGFEHRIGGLEKDYDSGDISYDPVNHERMTRVRAEKIERVNEDLDPPCVEGSELGELLMVGWGSTYGALAQATEELNGEGLATGHLHLRWLNPLPVEELKRIFARYKTIVVPELNMGQLVRILRERLLVDAIPVSRVQGQPFKVGELKARVKAIVEEGR